MSKFMSCRESISIDVIGAVWGEDHERPREPRGRKGIHPGILSVR
jgi:hypothetical protein